ncbi:MAG: CDP-alcohol phosphatidyltransferase family protein, partial [Patescibacteria group bacterium]|nr:CDP-alcohol phosphatidyltransferase family protein [Patescibacteria group bacterium]
MIILECAGRFLDSISKFLEKTLLEAISVFYTIKKRERTQIKSSQDLKEKILNTKFLKEQLFTVPNMFSLSRIPLGLALWPMLAYGFPFYITAPVMIIGLITDGLDGPWARKEGETILGQFLDPWCDKFFLFCCFLGFYSLIWEPVFWILLVIEAVLFAVSIITFFNIKFNWFLMQMNFKSNRW